MTQNFLSFRFSFFFSLFFVKSPENFLNCFHERSLQLGFKKFSLLRICAQMVDRMKNEADDGGTECSQLTELIGHGWLSHHFRASCVFMPAIGTPVFRVKLKVDEKKEFGE
jgi:hypothetical protein